MKFLTNHKQKVCLFATGDQSIYYDKAKVMNRVPQGTVLGPTVFLLYINEIFNHINNDKQLFSDDPKLFGIEYPQSNQHDIDELQDWAQDWLLQFNIGKCLTLYFGPNNPMANCTIYNPKAKVREQLESRTEERDLGVIIEDKFKFHGHVQQDVSQCKPWSWIIKMDS